MKILAIIGTPTRECGYTTKTVDALAESIKKQRPDAEIEYVYLEDIKLPRCQGFLTCVKQGALRCPFSEDVNKLVQSMLVADAVIFASPVHCFNVSTLMKNMIDLLVYQMHRPEFFGKKAIVVTSAAGAGQGGVLKYLRKTVSIWGFHVVGQLGTHSGLFEDPRYQPKLRKAADAVAGRLLRAIDRNVTPQPGIAQLINFRVWRSVIKRSKDASPYDWNYWHEAGWLEQDYYYPTSVNPLFNALAGFVEAMIERTIRNASVKPVT